MDMKAINHVMQEKLHDFIGLSAEVSTDVGRKKTLLYRGILKEVYPQVFVIETTAEDGNLRHLSFNYIDLFTGSVRLVLFRDCKAYQFSKAHNKKLS